MPAGGEAISSARNDAVVDCIWDLRCLVRRALQNFGRGWGQRQTSLQLEGPTELIRYASSQMVTALARRIVTGINPCSSAIAPVISGLLLDPAHLRLQRGPALPRFVGWPQADESRRRDVLTTTRPLLLGTNPMTTETTSPVPHHVEEAVATIAALHAAHHREARALQKAVSRATSGIAQPATLILTTFAIASWVTLNLALPEFGCKALDPFPFPLLAAVVSTIALYLAAMILMTQRHDDEMATRREQITLELAILSEQKSSKIIALLEEFRRNDPNQGNQRDKVAEALAEPADAQVVLDAIRAAEKAEDGG